MLDASASFAHTAVGTPYYLSPELCEGKAYNYKSDIWALGCLLYELCTFKHAFDATSLPALVMSIIRGEVEPIRQPYSAPLLRVIHECLSKDPGAARGGRFRATRATHAGMGPHTRAPRSSTAPADPTATWHAPLEGAVHHPRPLQ